MSRLARVAALTLLTTPAAARADRPDLANDVGLTLKLAVDGTAGDSNPLTTSLFFAPLALEVGHRVAPGVRVHASLGYGLLRGDETEGSTFELLVGGALSRCNARGWSCLGVALDVGGSHSAYDFVDEHARIEAILVEPRVAWSLATSDRWWLRLALGPRYKRIVGGEVVDRDADAASLWGTAFAATVARRW